MLCVDARVEVEVRVLSGWKEEKGVRRRLDRVRWKREEEVVVSDGGRMDGRRGWVERVEWVDGGYDVV